jgi:hypothetical protein
LIISQAEINEIFYDKLPKVLESVEKL